MTPVEPAGPLPPLLAGRDVVLRRPDPAGDVAALFAATHGSSDAEATWDHMGYGPWPDVGAMQAWMETTVVSSDPFWWVVERAGAPVGMASVLNHDAAHRRAEVGHIWYIPHVRRTTVNTEAAYLMIRTCFDTLRCRRVEWKCDALNQRSREAALRLGFVFEGVFRRHMIVKGRNRDTAWFAMTDTDWALARRRLEAWLYDTTRDASGKPDQRLTSPGRSS